MAALRFWARRCVTCESAELVRVWRADSSRRKGRGTVEWAVAAGRDCPDCGLCLKGRPCARLPSPDDASHRIVARVVGIRTSIAMARLGLGQRPRVAMGPRPGPGAEGPRRAATWRFAVLAPNLRLPAQRMRCLRLARARGRRAKSQSPRTASLRPAGPGPGGFDLSQWHRTAATVDRPTPA